MFREDLETAEERKVYLVNLRKRNIEEFERILNGRDVRYAKYMNDQTFLRSVQNQLDVERDLLEQLLSEED